MLWKLERRGQRDPGIAHPTIGRLGKLPPSSSIGGVISNSGGRVLDAMAGRAEPRLCYVAGRLVALSENLRLLITRAMAGRGRSMLRFVGPGLSSLTRLPAVPEN